ncbi:MAG: acetate--CoA ligase family protein [Candidatus Pacebacteria bacterium]|nr:acetate--CoA ligase family protein [Candidatus Paceibacterota bacterium]MDD2796456.1 acetate--CoA ligase family protein [Candidatus Paceibacterota bacterium]MDD3047842.1 acetate--CoA ligase family protein [Candidatus Paceibacterota bacterium]MDD3509672.1 acetate--CoA ligase family protein [Candidatus Paceibacterota bacterium]MDD3918702.1 acetate--CoA ligase family protein [Candidatus Paceibacterota bacterium]
MNLLSFKETKQLFRKHNISIKDTGLFQEKQDALNYANKIGFPVVLKIYSDKVIHKTEENAVITNIQNNKEFKKSFTFLDQKFKDKEGIIVQKQFKGRELVIGLNYDKTFGPVIMAGLGGIFVEVLNDVSFRLCPLKKRDAKEMLEELKGYRILQSFRGSKEVNLNKLQELLVNLSNFLLKEKNIHSVDFNPIFINEKEINIADFRIITKENV